MKIIKYFFILHLTLSFFLPLTISCSEIYEDIIFKNNIHTVLLNNTNNSLSYPIINIHNDEQLILMFDEITNEYKDYYYTIIHCNKDWTKSDLVESEYIDGFYDNIIEEYDFSFNTITKYIHYKLIFPNKNLKFIVTGNYIIKVYEDMEKKHVVLTKRFIVFENKINIETEIKRANNIEKRNTHQEIVLNLNNLNFQIKDPISEISLLIKQNNRDDLIIDSIKPIFIHNDKIIYDFHEGNLFPGGNEFRNFDSRSIRYYSSRIKNVIVDSNNISIELFPDVSRAFDEYISISDLNGNYIINKQEAWDSHLEAEYTDVTFSLLENRKINSSNIYILGRFTNWKEDKKYKLKYNENTRKYEITLLLKQGYYNYVYQFNDLSLINYIEGDYYETQNEYYIYIYYRETGSFHDQIIGYVKTSSKSLY
ncbi:MAG: hypothetical protein CMP51_05250 [Flavobacteriales bacterium]|nr:hypothetical protein [Flavobacteriales bacterium]